MKITFIGTGSGKTSLKRHHSSLLISSNKHNLLVDCGDGISSALLKQNISFSSIDSILISHLHPDHYSGLASLITQMKLVKRKKRLAIYVNSSLKSYLENLLLHSYLFKERLGFELNVISFDENDIIKVFKSFEFVSKHNSHLEKYKREIKKSEVSLVSLSFLFKDKNDSLIYTGDIGSGKDLFLFDEKSDWFITEISHINFEDILLLKEKSNFGKIILTHIDDELEKSIHKFIKSFQNKQKSNIIIAYDGLNLHHST